MLVQRDQGITWCFCWNIRCILLAFKQLSVCQIMWSCNCYLGLSILILFFPPNKAQTKKKQFVWRYTEKIPLNNGVMSDLVHTYVDMGALGCKCWSKYGISKQPLRGARLPKIGQLDKYFSLSFLYISSLDFTLSRTVRVMSDKLWPGSSVLL